MYAASDHHCRLNSDVQVRSLRMHLKNKHMRKLGGRPGSVRDRSEWSLPLPLQVFDDKAVNQTNPANRAPDRTRQLAQVMLALHPYQPRQTSTSPLHCYTARNIQIPPE